LSSRLRASAAAIALLLAAGCGSAATASHPVTTQRAAPAACFRAPGHREIGGDVVDIPRGLPGRPPLLIAFHGTTETVNQIAAQTAFDDLAASQKFVVAYPNSTLARRWQLNHDEGDADIARIRSLIEAVVKRVCADPRRVYLTGFSNGAGFAARAGCELAGRVAAIGLVSGSYRALDDCSAGPMPTLEIHGRDPWLSTVPALIRATKRRNSCTHSAIAHRIAPGIVDYGWPGCDLERVRNDTIGHEWPKLGPYNTSVLVWRFVRRYRR
jgi:polyhydroxybutyrate depolymerase